MSGKNIEILIDLIAKLRGEDGCPWDRKQTPRSIAVYLIEEAFELADAIESGKPEQIREELGDVLFQVLFITRLFTEMGHFDIKDVIRLNAEKMIRRHPHVFGEDKLDSPEDVKKRWHQIKMDEKKSKNEDSILYSVPANLPALIRAYRISERVGKVGFDWDDLSGVVDKVEEEWAELKFALDENNSKDAGLEFGDVLFTLVNVARFANIHPETSLLQSINKFEKRFRYIEKRISQEGKDLESVSMDDMEALWNEAKKKIEPQ
ncbi:nucleoside triphosphate pyrophosphohydrolase [Thermodesulfobacteriota bacterium]